MRELRRWLGTTTVLLALALGGVAPAAAQEATPEGGEGFRADPAFSNELLPGLGYPEINLRQPADGPVEGAPAAVPAGRYLVTLEAEGEVAAYVDFVQIPAGVSAEEATARVLESARDDVPHEGYVYGGGSYALASETVSFVVDLEPGDWRVAASRQAGGEDAEEIMELVPLRVTGGTPTAFPVAAVPAAVTLELRDVAFGGLEQPVPTGPRIWEVTNVGEQPRQVVLWRTPRPVTTEEFLGMMGSLMAGTPPAVGGLTPDQLTWVGYAAILSPGRTVWEEFDFAPGTYLAVSYVLDPEAGAPAFLLGMVQPFTVEAGATPAASLAPTPACPAGVPPGRVAAVANEATIRLTDQGFDPAVVQATSGHDLTITLINTGSRPHAFVLDDFRIDVELAPGGRETVTITPGDRGDAVEYSFSSDAPGDECMQGLLVFYI